MATTCKLIAKNVLGSDTSSVTFSSIPGTYTDLYLVISARSDRNLVVSGADVPVDDVMATFNSSTSNFSGRRLVGTGSSVPYQATVSSDTTTRQIGFCTTLKNTADTFGSSEAYIPNYAGSTNKSFSFTGLSENNAAVAFIVVGAGLWSDTSAITSIGLSPNGGTNFKSGSSFFLYGITKA
jgi:hypothetical protein